MVAEYLLLGKVISLLGKVAGKIGQGIKGITYYLSNGMPAAADGVIAIGGAEAIAISGSLKSALVSAGDILFNYSAFENDWDKLKEEWEEAENSTSISNNAHVYYNGKETAVYRGGSDFTVRPNDVKIDPKTGNVQTRYGVSVNVDPDAVSQFGGSYKIESIPDGLQIIQRGSRPTHFEIVPAYEMPLEAFQELLNQIVVSGPY